MGTRHDGWNARPVAIALSHDTLMSVGARCPSAFTFMRFQEQMSIVRDTLVVLCMQVTFRTVMFLRHLNY